MTRFLITTYMFPPILLAIPYTIVIVQLGLMNTWIGLVITYLSFSIPYAVWMLIGFFSTVPIEIEEAAKVDGANRLVILAKLFYQLLCQVLLQQRFIRLLIRGMNFYSHCY